MLTRNAVGALGGDHERVVSDRVLLITPRNVGLTPTLSEQRVTARVARMRRVFAAVPRAGDVAAATPADISFGPVADETAFQAEVRMALEMAGVKITEGTSAGGGALDLLAEDAVLIENKFEGRTAKPEQAKPAAGMQGRRYAIALNVQLVIVMVAYRPKAGVMLDKTQSVEVLPIAGAGGRRAELRIMLPYDAVVPSREKSGL